MLLFLECSHDEMMIASHDLNIELQLGEEMMVKVHFAELTQLSAQQLSSNPFDLILP